MKMKHSHKSPVLANCRHSACTHLAFHWRKFKLTSNYKLPTVAGWKRIRDKS